MAEAPEHALGRPTSAPRIADEPDRPLGRLLGPVVRGWRTLALAAGVTAIVVGTFVVLQPVTYTASASFMPQSQKGGAGLAGFAAQFGIAPGALGGMSGGDSPVFYADLIKSREILGAVADDTVRANGRPVTVSALYAAQDEATDAPAPLQRAQAIRRLTRDVQVTMSARTGVVRLDVHARSPDVALQLAQALLAQVDRFNIERRRTQAAAERRFAETRLIQARSELRDAENRLQAFLQGNREFGGSPQLAFERERISRDVELRQTVYVQLAQGLEQAKIDEVRDTPVVTVVDRPERPVERDPRGLGKYLVLATIFGTVVAASWIIVRQAWRDTDATR